MVDTEQIKSAIERLYLNTNEPKVDVPLELQAIELAHFARDYIAAASVVAEQTPALWLPRLQLTGHAVELSLKACLASAKSIPPSEHDLIKLYQKVEECGFQLTSRDVAAIVHLRHFYFQDLATETKYKTRYPSKKFERLGGSVPSHSTFDTIVNSLLEQAKTRDTGDGG